jgi:hypothetical protein
MKMGAFLLGGLVGAAVVMYWNRNKTMFAGFSSHAGNWMGKPFQSSARVNKSTDKFSANDSDAGLEKVESMIKQDPEVKRQVDEILHESNKYTQ